EVAGPEVEAEPGAVMYRVVMMLPFTRSGHREPAAEHAARRAVPAGQAAAQVIAVDRVAVAVEDEVTQQGDQDELSLEAGPPGAPPVRRPGPVVAVPQVGI